jgi:hypothetical protein
MDAQKTKWWVGGSHTRTLAVLSHCKRQGKNAEGKTKSKPENTPVFVESSPKRNKRAGVTATPPARVQHVVEMIYIDLHASELVQRD